MTGEVKEFPGVRLRHRGPEAQPVPDVIELLERLLQDAQKGELRGIAIAGVYPFRGNSTVTAWDRPQDGDYGHEMGAAIACLFHRYFQDRTGGGE